MERKAKEKQIVVRFDKTSYDKISEYAKFEHRGLGEFVRHATLVYMDVYSQEAGTPYLPQFVSNRVKNID